MSGSHDARAVVGSADREECVAADAVVRLATSAARDASVRLGDGAPPDLCDGSPAVAGVVR